MSNPNLLLNVYANGSCIQLPPWSTTCRSPKVWLYAAKRDIDAMFEVEPQSEEIYDVINWAQEGGDQGTPYPGISYEQDIIDGLMWLEGFSDHNPIDD